MIVPVNLPYQEHDVEKQKQIAEYATALIDYDLVLSKLVSRESVDQFKGQEGDALTFRVPGRLPYRKYAWRNDRTDPIIRDVYSESKVSIDWGGHIYSAVHLTDEQRDFDLNGWEPLLTAQSAAVAQGVNDNIADTIRNAPYEVTIGGAEQALFPAIVEARRVLNAFRVPNTGQRILAVGPDFESAMLLDKRITLAQNSGDQIAQNALSDAVIGRIGGFTVVLDQTLGAEAYAFAGSAFVQYTGAPSIPRSVYGGANVNVNGTSARWLTDYDQDRMLDRSLVDTWVGSAAVTDMFLPKSVLTEWGTPVNLDPSTLNRYFVRGVKLTLDGASVYPAASKTDLVAETGISAANAWNAADHVDEPATAPAA